MALLGIDLGGTKLAYAVFTDEGRVLFKESAALENRKGGEVGKMITDKIRHLIGSCESEGNIISSIGISVPGISHVSSGTIWAPNIAGWEDYPLLREVQVAAGDIPVTIDSDRACYILGESWQGNARGCKDAIYLSVGTGIGAGILINGEILRGKHDIAGCIGWMALQRPFEDKFTSCGCFEYYASGEGIVKVAKSYLMEQVDYSGELRTKDIDALRSYDVFAAYDNGDPLAVKVIGLCIEFWGMAVANLVSLFDPEKIIFGGGVFGPGKKLLPAVMEEAKKWAQPVSIRQVSLHVSGLEGDAGVYGAGFLALKKLSELDKNHRK
jgi:glucokinase